MGREKARGGVVNRRGWGKARVVNSFMGWNVCPGREPDCLKPAGTGVGVNDHMYNDSNLLGGRAKEGRGSECRHAGTGEISACNMLRIHIETGQRRVAEVIAVTGGLYSVDDFKANLSAQCWRDWVATTKSLTTQ